jgi:hypothetical protein
MEPDKTFDSLREKILKGIEISFEKLVKEKAKNDEELIFDEDGQIIRVKAKDILKDMSVKI